MKIINISENDAGQRLDSFLKKLMPCASAGLVYKYIRTNKIKLCGKKPKPDARLLHGDVLHYYGDASLLCAKKFTQSDYELNVVYEDENILVVNKPPGIASQPDDANKSGTLVDNVKNYLYAKGDYRPDVENSFSPALCNRLDRNTAGLCIAAKNAAALRLLNEKLKNREIRRFYVCITDGVPPQDSGTVKMQIQKNSSQNKSFAVSEGGKSSQTNYRTLKKSKNSATLELEIISGRSHQIRLHMAHIGCPVAGDPKYGNGGRGQKLMSHKINFQFNSDARVLNYLNGKEITIPYPKTTEAWDSLFL